ncbi:hypothetical protein NQ315_002693 [Exocentrus adspersus]|uniref:Uncharacterized protein n=1 Tax=Exocentrus adspersus TaxID=1586481 RepID=A0AAV8VHI1_9CUCU|nr:hypothetical protein NQ315_002693 [Exocentrus adspersus]
MTTLKRHGGWRSSTVPEGYLADSMELKNKTTRMLAGISDEGKCIKVDRLRGFKPNASHYYFPIRKMAFFPKLRFVKFGPQIVFLWNTQHYR